MKKLQIYIEPELDSALAVAAARGGTSKAALVRQFVAAGLGVEQPADDPLDELVGRYDEPPGRVDDVVYPR